ncbi:Peptidase A1 domain-containing protein [Aphelenchoides fujianensis]|nr:Peptidase A1 domain-containing protein [Aphelenchoides fujianensis]
MQEAILFSLLLLPIDGFQIPLISKSILPAVKSTGHESSPLLLLWDERLSSFYLNEFPNEYLLTNCTIGTPEKEFFVAVESGSKFLWVLDAANPEVRSDQHTYDPRLVFCSPLSLLSPTFSSSSTSSFIRDDFNTSTGNTQLFGNAYVDVFNIQMPVPQAFGSIRRMDASGDRPDVPLDGAIGLAWGPFGEDPQLKYMSPIVNILGYLSFAQQFYTIWIDHHVPPSQGRVNGLITIGNFDDAHCDDRQLKFVPLTIDESADFMRFVVQE